MAWSPAWKVLRRAAVCSKRRMSSGEKWVWCGSWAKERGSFCQMPILYSSEAQNWIFGGVLDGALDGKADFGGEEAEGFAGEEVDVARGVPLEPVGAVVVEGEGVGKRDADDGAAAGDEELGGLGELGAGVGDVLEGVGEEDGIEGAGLVEEVAPFEEGAFGGGDGGLGEEGVDAGAAEPAGVEDADEVAGAAADIEEGLPEAQARVAEPGGVEGGLEAFEEASDGVFAAEDGAGAEGVEEAAARGDSRKRGCIMSSLSRRDVMRRASSGRDRARMASKMASSPNVRV